MRVDTAELAKIYEVQKSAITAWIKDGCPVAKKGIIGKRGSAPTPHIFDTKAVTKWREKRAAEKATGSEFMSRDESSRRKLQADAAIRELELAKLRDEVVELRDIEIDLRDRFAVFRSAIRKIPERSVIRVVGNTDESAVKRILLDEIDTALELLSNE